MKKLLLLCMMLALTALGLPAQTNLQTLSAFTTQAKNFYVIEVPNPDGAWYISSLSVSVGTPAVGDSTCGVRIYVVDWNQGTFSYYVFLGAGGWSANQTIVFPIPKDHGVAIWAQNSGNCSSYAKDVNIAAQYTVEH